MVHPVTATPVTPEPHVAQPAAKAVAPKPSEAPAYSVKLSSGASADVDHDGDSR